MKRALTGGYGKMTPQYRWAWSYGKRAGTVEANTRSEARNLVKGLLLLPGTTPLPSDVRLIRLPPESAVPI